MPHFARKLQVLRFAPPLSFGSFGRLSSEGTVPEALLVAPFLEEEAVLSAPSSFCGPQGSQQDGNWDVLVCFSVFGAVFQQVQAVHDVLEQYTLQQSIHDKSYIDS